MRTTVTLADDVAAAVDQLKRAGGGSVSDAVNELIRRGLRASSQARRFHQHAFPMGESRIALDDIGGLLDAVDGPTRR